jgi:hypothetical protein
VLRLHERDIDIEEITVARPSMDDVFFALTGSGGAERRDAA